MFEVNDLGCDFNSSWTFTDGDLNIVNGKDNLIQSIVNRLNTKLDSLDLFYQEYGSKIYGFLGWKNGDDTLSFIELEINDTLQQDPRCQNYSVTVSYYQGKIIAEVTISFDEDTDLSFNLVLNEYGRVDLFNNTIEIEIEEEEE